MSTLISGIMITISSNSWMGAWMGLEINLLSFIPMMTNNSNIYTTESSLKYFLIQALASSILLFVIISKTMLEDLFSLHYSLFSMAILTPLLLKSGAAPFHWWFPSVMEGLNWMNCFILMSLQKIAPLILISFVIKINLFSMLTIIMSIFMGSIGGYNQTSIRKILTYSSINHLGWMLTAMLLGKNYWLMYFSLYSILVFLIIAIMKPFQLSFINQVPLLMKDNSLTKFMFFTSLLSLGGLPPFLGFLPKWIIIQEIINENLLFLITFMVIMSLITLYYYLRLSYSSFMILHSEPSWNIQTNNEIEMYTIILLVLSMIGLILSTFISSIF
uniref:NADH-ubiquinone oxidoreductase chain 2 n=1 Tax=Carbrunneria paramaxi TaxID=2093489 RepID=A0A2P1H993_9NEOP|nr:NADH dehydrogenase subunit 2 [Carbrunneria paramaxi]